MNKVFLVACFLTTACAEGSQDDVVLGNLVDSGTDVAIAQEPVDSGIDTFRVATHPFATDAGHSMEAAVEVDSYVFATVDSSIYTEQTIIDAAIPAVDSYTAPVSNGCLFQRSAIYNIQYTQLTGNCGMVAQTIPLTGALTLLAAGQAIEVCAGTGPTFNQGIANEYDNDCQAEASSTCTAIGAYGTYNQGDQMTTNTQISIQSNLDGSILTGTLAVSENDITMNQLLCIGTYSFIATTN